MTRLKDLEELNFENTGITDTGLGLISQTFPSLHELNLSGTEVTANGIAQLKQLRNLTLLRANTVSPAEPFLAKLQNSSKLQDVELIECDLNDNDLQKLSTISSLKSLQLSENIRITARGIEYLSKLPDVIRVNVEGCNLPFTTTESFRKMRNLQELLLSTKSWTEDERNRFTKSMPRTSIKYEFRRSHPGAVPNHTEYADY